MVNTSLLRRKMNKNQDPIEETRGMVLFISLQLSKLLVVKFISIHYILKTIDMSPVTA